MAIITPILYIKSFANNVNIYEVANKISLQPTRLWQKGETIISNGVDKKAIYPNSTWCYEFFTKETTNVADEISVVLKSLLNHENEIK